MWLQASRGNNRIIYIAAKFGYFNVDYKDYYSDLDLVIYPRQLSLSTKLFYVSCQHYPSYVKCQLSFELHMVIFLDGGNVTWTSYTPIDRVQ